uniref:(northern house mosquito) hypothetical protein n=1 Tax=Culex pipiens TaxID=7175 RepID=A0A8D8IC04_CULPI
MFRVIEFVSIQLKSPTPTILSHTSRRVLASERGFDDLPWSVVSFSMANAFPQLLRASGHQVQWLMLATAASLSVILTESFGLAVLFFTISGSISTELISAARSATTVLATLKRKR